MATLYDREPVEGHEEHFVFDAELVTSKIVEVTTTRVPTGEYRIEEFFVEDPEDVYHQAHALAARLAEYVIEDLASE